MVVACAKLLGYATYLLGADFVGKDKTSIAEKTTENMSHQSLVK